MSSNKDRRPRRARRSFTPEFMADFTRSGGRPTGRNDVKGGKQVTDFRSV